jgi:LysR family transcriptional regulator, hydrogen peroxide-inducible genes activator
MITLTQLEYIVAVDTYRHFGKAAESCFITQPTLSMQIKKLEEDLEIIIFDRSRQPLIPTDVGQRIIEQARVVLKETEEITNIVKNINMRFRECCVLALFQPWLLTFCRYLLAGTKRSIPNIHIKVIEQTTNRNCKLLKRI